MPICFADVVKNCNDVDNWNILQLYTLYERWFKNNQRYTHTYNTYLNLWEDFIKISLGEHRIICNFYGPLQICNEKGNVMKMWAFSKPRRTCYCHFPVFLATGGVRPKYQFFTAAEFKKSQEVIRGGKEAIGSAPASCLTLLAIIFNTVKIQKRGRRKNIENKKGPVVFVLNLT